MSDSKKGEERRGGSLPLFAPASQYFWRLILPRTPGIVYYILEREE